MGSMLVLSESQVLLAPDWFNTPNKQQTSTLPYGVNAYIIRIAGIAIGIQQTYILLILHNNTFLRTVSNRGRGCGNNRSGGWLCWFWTLLTSFTRERKNVLQSMLFTGSVVIVSVYKSYTWQDFFFSNFIGDFNNHWTREVNNRLTGWAFAHLVKYFAHPVN